MVLNVDINAVFHVYITVFMGAIQEVSWVNGGCLWHVCANQKSAGLTQRMSGGIAQGATIFVLH